MELMDLMRTNRTYRRFKQTAVSDEIIGEIMEAARNASSAEPVLFIGVVENTDINKNCDTDAGLAIANMRLAAWAHGVGSCIIGACDRQKISEIFGLTDNQALHTVIAFGYPSHTSRIEDMKDGDVKYYLDDNRDYVVPKRRVCDVVKEI